MSCPVPPSNIELSVRGLKFRAYAEGEGDPVLCLHGFPDHARSFRHQLGALADAGYRAIAPQMRGYDPGSQPSQRVSDYHPLQLARDIIALAGELGDGEPIHLVGHDWGAVAGALACQEAPDRFRSFTSIAIANSQAVEDGIRKHPVQLKNSWYIFFFQLRGLADVVVSYDDFAFLERLWRDWSPGWEWDPREMELLKETFRQPGVRWSALAYYRAMLNPFLADSKRVRTLTRAPSDVPTLAVTGALDGCMDTRLFDHIDATLYPRGVRVERLEGAGHFLHQEKPAEFNPLLLDWLRSHDAS